MARFSSKEIAEILNPKTLLTADGKDVIDTFIIDSRSVVDNPSSTIFFAIATSTGDGHRFIDELHKRGVRNFVVDRDCRHWSDSNFYVVDDTVTALQKLAGQWRTTFLFPVIAVTGSRGKTEVKEWLYSMLRNRGIDGQRSPRSYNSQIGVALSLLSFDNNRGQFAIVETGISRSGEMAKIASMVNPETGIFTNITDEHDDGFKSREEKIKEKMLLFTRCNKVIFNGNSDISEVINKFVADSSRVVVTMKPGYSHDDENKALAEAAAEIIAPGIDFRNMETESIATRIDVEKGLNNCIILHDRFTNDLESLSNALDFASRRVTANRSLTLIIDSSSFNEEFNNESVANMAAKYAVGRIIAVDNVDQFKSRYNADSFADEIILVKGNPSSRFSDIVSMLEAKQHETVLEVNLDNLVFNYNFFRSKLPADTGLIVMLKADGYGCGALELAKTLQSQGAAAIAVAVVDEGVELRKAGITMPVIVLNPRARNSSIMIENKLEPEVYSFELLQQIIDNVERCGISGFPIHIKIDSGMHRLGFCREDLPGLVEILNTTDAVKVATVFSHLATADCLDMDQYTEGQLSYFNDCVNYMTDQLSYPIKSHILNTAGILRYPAHHHDFARLGIGLYGLPVINSQEETLLRPVSALYSTVIALARRHQGDTIGYGRKGVVDSERVIATVPIGYADGIDRHLGNGRVNFIVNGHQCPTIGNICMDICMIDVTGANCSVGDKVEIFGPETGVCRLSEILGTIPYEIITSISPRVKRVYYRE